MDWDRPQTVRVGPVRDREFLPGATPLPPPSKRAADGPTGATVSVARRRWVGRSPRPAHRADGRGLISRTSVRSDMSVVAEFMIPAEAFAFGEALSTDPPMTVLLERIVPVDGAPTPFIWVSGGDFDGFETTVRESEHVTGLSKLDEIEGRRLYRVGWEPEGADLLGGIVTMEGVILQASGAGTWTFQLRFPDHDHLGEFYSYVTENDIALNVDNVQVLAEDTGSEHDFDLTMEQREALTLAVRRGFYEVPRGTTLSALADELGVSNQAASERIRRGSARVLGPFLLGEE